MIFDPAHLALAGLGFEETASMLDYFKRLVPFLSPDVYAWDDAGNNKALISGQASLIFNPPSAWAVAVRDGIYRTIVDAAPDGATEFFHGYTYSAHPVACAAAA